MKNLNDDIAYITRANAMLNPINPKSGLIMIGNAGLEFKAKKGLGYIQIPWQSMTSIRVQMFLKGRYVRGFYIETDEDQVFDFVVSDAKQTLREMRKYLERKQFVVNHSNFSQLFKGYKR